MWELVRANQRRTAGLVVLLAALLLALGYATGELVEPGAGPLGLAGALVLWLALALAGYFEGDRILLAASRARRLRRDDHPVLWNVVEEMCIASGLAKMPEIWILDEAAPRLTSRSGRVKPNRHDGGPSMRRSFALSPGASVVGAPMADGSAASSSQARGASSRPSTYARMSRTPLSKCRKASWARARS